MDDYLERLDAWLDGEDEGTIPLDVLRGEGIDAPPPESLDDDALHAALWRVIDALPEIGIVIEYTDHLSDRELYVKLVTETLTEPAFLPENAPGVTVYDMSSEDSEVYLTYYADDETRADWARDFPDEPMPPKKPLPYNRDSRIGSFEQHLLMRGET